MPVKSPEAIARRKIRSAAYQRERQVHFNCKRYGIEPAEYNRLLAEQGGCCAVCGNTPTGTRLAIDHDHQTGTVRGLLCRFCNTGLGAFHDTPSLLTAAIEYLKRYQ